MRSVQLAQRENNWVGPSAAFAAQAYSEETARLIDAEVARIINECHEDAKRLLAEHRRELDELVAALMSREALDEKEILDVTGLPPTPPLSDGPLIAEGAAKVER